jgi:hypothetical protein
MLQAADRRVLHLLATVRVASSTQIRRLVFEPELALQNASNSAATRANRRLLTRLVREKLVRRLPQRIGGPGGGSAAPIYVLTSLGQRVIDVDRPLLREPSWQLLAHSLAITEIVVVTAILHRRGELKLRVVSVEAEAWRRWPGPTGLPETLKPDAFVELERDGYLEAWFVEADLGTERARVIRTKAARYQRYRRCGQEQQLRGLFPRVLWTAPDRERALQLQEVLAGLEHAQRELHVTCAIADTAAVLRDEALPGQRSPP